jgi:metal-sulfur cluster biosynthetic enzyme
MKIITNNIEKSTNALQELKSIIDPEIELSIVDLGLIYQLDFDEEKRIVYCTYTLTTAFCPIGEILQNNIFEVLQNCFQDYKINLELSFNPRWSDAMISEKGKNILNKI